MADDGHLTISLDAATVSRLRELARSEGASPETLAADVVADMLSFVFDAPERLRLDDVSLRAGLQAQMRRLEEGGGELSEHDDVVKAARQIIEDARPVKP